VSGVSHIVERCESWEINVLPNLIIEDPFSNIRTPTINIPRLEATVMLSPCIIGVIPEYIEAPKISIAAP
jgi:hypothetical protein